MENKKIYLASNIKFLRNKHKKTQQDLAKICDKKNTAISNWERGIREPDAMDLSKISNYFNVTIDDLMTKNLKNENNSNLHSNFIIQKDCFLMDNDIKNQESILSRLDKNIYDFFDLDFKYSPCSEEEVDFGLESYSNFIELYEILIRFNKIKRYTPLSQKQLDEIIEYINENKNILKETLNYEKNEHLKKWEDFTNSPLYKKYIENLDKYN